MGTELEDFFTEAAASDTGGEDSFDLTNATVNMGDHEDVVEDADVGDDGESDHVEIGDVEDDPEDTTEGVTDENVFDLSTYKDQEVTVKINGVDTVVKLGEAVSGYMRQADYTQKTQANAEALRQAEWAAQLQQAIQSDPQGTIKYLANAYGLDLAAQTSVDPYENIDPEFAPLVQTVRQQEQALAQMQAQLQAQSRATDEERYLMQAKTELWNAKQEFPEMDEVKVLEKAMELNLSVRDAYLRIVGEEALSEKKSKIAAASKADKVADVLAKKRAQSGKAVKASGAGKAVDTDPVFDDFESMMKFELARSK